MKKFFKNIICTLLFIQFLSIGSVFAKNNDFMEKALNSWVGYNINDVIDHWGFPTEEKTIANRHIYIWGKSWSQYVPQTTNSTINRTGCYSTVNSYSYGGYTVNLYRNITFEVNNKNNIISWHWEGNAFPKNYKKGKELVNPKNDEWERERLRKLEEKRIKKEEKAKAKLEKQRAKKLQKDI